MFARITTVTLAAGKTSADLLHVHGRLLRLLRKMPGFVRYSAMIDRKDAKAVAITYWQTEADMQVRSEALSRLRAEIFADLGVVEVTVAEYEVAHHS